MNNIIWSIDKLSNSSNLASDYTEYDIKITFTNSSFNDFSSYVQIENRWRSDGTTYTVIRESIGNIEKSEQMEDNKTDFHDYTPEEIESYELRKTQFNERVNNIYEFANKYIERNPNKRLVQSVDSNGIYTYHERW